MVEINASREIDAPPYAVWKIVSDADSEPLCWQNLTVSSKVDRVMERAVAISFSDLKTVEIVGGLHTNKLIEVSLSEISAIGRRIILLKPVGDNNKTRIEASWNIRLTNVPLLFRGRVRNEVMKGTKEALDRIARAAAQQCYKSDTDKQNLTSINKEN